MADYFEKCFTEEEIKGMYRRLAMTMHPDKGGGHEQFLELQRQYEFALATRSREPKLPEIFEAGRPYEYSRAPVMYEGCDNHWYRFSREKGANVWIDAHHIHLIRIKANTFIY